MEPWAQRWSQPHASTPSLEDLLRLKRLLANGTRAALITDVEAEDIGAVIHLVCVELVKRQTVDLETGAYALFVDEDELFSGNIKPF